MFNNHMGKILIWFVAILITITLAPLSVIGASYLLVESNTSIYAEEFYNVQRNTSWQGEISYIKVFRYTDKSAKVFMVEWQNKPATKENKAFRTGSYYNFTRQDKTKPWELDNWETVWSEGGSADDWTWPPYF